MTIKKQNNLGVILVISSFIFCHAETFYFGYNMLPKTVEEFACDVISLIGFILGWAMIIIACNRTIKEETKEKMSRIGRQSFRIIE